MNEDKVNKSINGLIGITIVLTIIVIAAALLI